jgi:hypothetical protein
MPSSSCNVDRASPQTIRICFPSLVRILPLLNASSVSRKAREDSGNHKQGKWEPLNQPQLLDAEWESNHWLLSAFDPMLIIHVYSKISFREQATLLRAARVQLLPSFFSVGNGPCALSATASPSSLLLSPPWVRSEQLSPCRDVGKRQCSLALPNRTLSGG